MAQTVTALKLAALAEAACYSLPYGGIGAASHLITYYTMAMLFFGRQPLPPFRPLKHETWSTLLGLVQLMFTIVLSAITIHRCQNQWPFLLLSVWMLTTSLCLSVLTISAPAIFSREAAKYKSGTSNIPVVKLFLGKSASTPQSEESMMEYSRPRHRNRSRAIRNPLPRQSLESFLASFGGLICLGTGVLWFCGCVAGMMAIIMVTIPQFKAKSSIGLDVETGLLGGLAFLALFFLFFKFCVGLYLDELHSRLFVIISVTICFGALLWMDLTLGLVTGNLVGRPAPSAKLLYWTYIVVKRLPLAAM